MIRIRVLDRKRKMIIEAEVGSLGNLLKDKDKIVWVDIVNAKVADYKVLKDVFNFHPVTIDDCRHVRTLPKIDFFDDYVFLIVHAAHFEKNKEYLKMKELDIYLSKNYVVTVHLEEMRSINNTLEKMKLNPSNFFHGPDFIMHDIIDFMVDNYFDVVDYWDIRIDEVETEALQSKLKRDLLKDMILIKKALIKLRKTVLPQRDVISRLSKGEAKFISRESLFYYSDINDHIHRIYNMIENQRDLLGSVFDAYFSSLSINMTETSNKINRVMQRLTIVSTIFLPLTFVTSLYGMNFRNMPELEYQYGYFILLAMMIVLGVGLFIYLRKNYWEPK